MIDRNRIEGTTRALQQEILDNRELLCPDYNGDLLTLLRPRILAQLLCIDFNEVYGLSEQVRSFDDPKQKVAGLIDRKQNFICVGTEFPREVQRFTAFHELGHCVLHPDRERHRDRPMDGAPQITRPLFEREADFFAAAFLMPRKSVRAEFNARFGEGPLTFHNTNAQLVCQSRAHELLEADEVSLDREIAVATCTYFGRSHFPPLNARFGVSATAMAIRLRELNLIKWP